MEIFSWKCHKIYIFTKLRNFIYSRNFREHLYLFSKFSRKPKKIRENICKHFWSSSSTWVIKYRSSALNTPPPAVHFRGDTNRSHSSLKAILRKQDSARLGSVLSLLLVLSWFFPWGGGGLLFKMGRAEICTFLCNCQRRFSCEILKKFPKWIKTYFS